MGKLNQTTEEIEDYNIDIQDEAIENMPFSVVYLTIQTSNNSYEYRILADNEFPRIEMIPPILEEGLNRAKLNPDDHFSIIEDPYKLYLSVNYLPEGEFKFLGKRVS